ncbi:bifunctional DNA primase/polymerase [Nocardioides sp. NPDC057772]|uniref:bifunctional DNA primase/polymerase n=1 Tax=unclassified Nocardioides TaxID=2615069 RepID=UPI0002028B58|nr:bifunctional DNA primase/polymerase [Nocardioides sp. NBC_00368]EGD42804.1 putative prophage Lp4 protein 7, DNA replication [Nocardioidaceae bacterium Broad-1]
MNDAPNLTPHWSPQTMRDAAAAGSLKDAAVALATTRIPVFPCVPGGKEPLTLRGFKDASISIRQVQRWWQRHPDANIGIPTGAASGLAAVDVDVHGDRTGFAAFDRAGRAGLVDRWSWLVRTPSGGLHAYFRPIDPEMRSWSLPGQHLDFRGDGGYVIAPPSRISNSDATSRAYQVIAVAQHQARPLDSDALRRFLDPPRAVRPPAALTLGDARPDRLAHWVATRPEGARNQSLFWAACRMAEGGQRYDVAVSMLGDAAQTAGLPSREAESTIRSAYRIASRLGPQQTRGSGRGPTRTSEAVAI